MVFGAATLALAPLLFLALTAGVRARVLIQDNAIGGVWDDLEFPLSSYGGPIGSAYFSYNPGPWLLWNATSPDGGYGPFVRFFSERTLADPPLTIGVLGDGVQGNGLIASRYASVFKYVQPDGAPDFYSFILLWPEGPELAITAPPSLGFYSWLTLQPYDPSNKYQQFAFYDTDKDLSSVATGSKAALGTPIPIPIIDGDSGAHKL